MPNKYIERAEMGCFKMSPSKLRLYHLHNSPGFACTFRFQALHQFRTAVTALEQSQTMLVKFGISLAIYILKAK